MSNLQITTVGLNAIANADAGGYKLVVKSFKVSSYSYGSAENLDLNAVSLKGSVVYSGNVSSIEILNDSNVRYECVIPNNFPSTGSISLGEIGLYLDSGELFAVGKISPSIIKDSNISFTIYTILSASRLSVTIEVTVSDTLNLSRSKVDLLQPTDLSPSSVIVSDSRTSNFSSNYASLAIKFGPGDNEWSFVGYNLIARCSADLILSKRSFKLDPNLNGFWLNDNEKILVQIVNGTGSGEVKKFTYNKQLDSEVNVFESESDFYEFGSDSILAFWRDSSVIYPDRRGVAPTQVLFAGENTHSSTWDTSSPVSGTLKVKSVYFTSVVNQYLYNIPSNIPKSYLDKNNVLLFIDGKLQSFNDFNIYDSQLVTSPATGNFNISLYIFYRENSTGSKFKLYEEIIEIGDLVSYSGSPSFELPIIPDSVDSTLGFYFKSSFGSENKHDWNVSGSKLIFNYTPGTDTLMLVWGHEEVFNGYSQPKQYEWYYNSNNSNSFNNTHVFKLSDTPTEDSYILFAKGELIPKKLYSIVNNEIIISKDDLTLTEGDCVKFIWILNKIANSSSDFEQYLNIVSNPNKITSSINGFLASTKVFKVPTPINDNYILVFIKGLKQEKNVDWKLQGVDEIVLLTTVPDDYPVDIVTFQEDTSGNGSLLNCLVYNEKTVLNKSFYSVPYPCDSSNKLLVFIDGIYLHKSFYSLANQTSSGFDLQFLSTLPPANCEIEFIIFDSENLTDSRTDLSITKPIPHVGFKKFEIDYNSVLQQNTFMFIGPVYQHKNTYTLKSNEVTLSRSIPYSILDPKKYIDLQVEIFSFVSGKNLKNIDKDLAKLAQTIKPARNTGPYWADPAGTNRTPNKVSVSTASFISSASTKYIFNPPYEGSNILVFVHGALQNKDRDFVYLSLGQIAFTSKIPDGYPVDIITFQSVEDSYGYELDMKVFELVSNSTNNYIVNYKLEDEQNLFIFVEGVYFHKQWYKVVTTGNTFSIQFVKGLIDDLKIEVNIWNQFQSKNSYTELFVQLPNPAIGAKNIVLQESVVKKNTLIFAGPIYQSKNTYKVNDLTLQLDTPINYQYVDPINFKDMPVTLFCFRTGPSKSRLITRDELRDNYMTRHGGDLKGPLYTIGDPESELEVANKRYVDAIKQQVEQMQDLIAKLQGVGSSGSFSPVLSIAPNLIKIGDVTTIKITNAPPGKSVELEVRGVSGVYNQRSVKGITKLDGTFSIGPVGVDNGYSDYLTVTAWVDGFRVANTVDIKVTEGNTISGPAMISADKDIYNPYDYITYSIADGTPGGKVTWSINGANAVSVPAGQQQYVGSDGTWSMQVPAGGVPNSYIVELFVDSISAGTLNIIVSPSNTEKLPTITYSASEIFRDEVIEVNILDAKPFAPVTFSAKAVGVGRSGPTDTAGLINNEGKLNFGFRFTSPGEYVIYITINRNLFTHALKVKQVSPSDILISNQVEGYRAYIKQY